MNFASQKPSIDSYIYCRHLNKSHVLVISLRERKEGRERKDKDILPDIGDELCACVQQD